MWCRFQPFTLDLNEFGGDKFGGDKALAGACKIGLRPDCALITVASSCKNVHDDCCDFAKMCTDVIENGSKMCYNVFCQLVKV